MSVVSSSPAEAQLAQLLERLNHWRQRRSSRREPIPDEFWDEAVSLTTPLALSRVAKRLRLNRQELKKQCQQRHPAPSPVQAVLPEPDFIEVKTEAAWLPPGMEIDVQRADGVRLRIHYREPEPPLAAVVKAFLESR